MIKIGKKKIITNLILAMFVINQTLPMGFCVVQNSSSKLRTAQPQAIKLETDVISKKNPKITLSLRDSDVKQVLRLLADKAGLNIIFHNSVDESDTDSKTNSNAPAPQQSFSWNSQPKQQPIAKEEETPTRKVTLDLVNVPLNDAFRMIIQVSGLTYYKDGNTLIISSAKASSSLNLSKQEVSSIPVKYADAASMAYFLNKNIFSIGKPGLSNGEVAVVNTASNEILIFGTHNDYVMAKKIIEQFDKKPLEETFIVNHTTPREMAYLVCNVLFKNLKDAQELYKNSEESEEDDTNNIDIKWEDEDSGDSSDSSSSSSSSNSSSSGGGEGGSSSLENADQEVKKIKLGQAYTACHYRNFIQSDDKESGSQGQGPAGSGQNSSGAEKVSLVSLTNGGITVSFFPQRGTLSVHGGSEQQMEMVREFISRNDKKQLQAYLEISILEITDSGTKDFQNYWALYSDFFSASFSGNGLGNRDNPMFLKGGHPGENDEKNPWIGPNGIAQRYTGAPTIMYAMNYLIKNEKARLLANPRIIITNGEKAAIDLTKDYLKKLKSQTQNATSTGATSSSIVSKEVEIGSDCGVSVVIQPFISPDGYVTLNIAPKYTNVYDQYFDPNNGDQLATFLQRRGLNLKNIRIKDGETLVIGGMIQEKETKSVGKAPILGDLPGIGMLFRNTNNKKEKEELVIMLTPRIIKEDNSVAKKSNETL
ncbi:MAG: hypothetical protein MJ229_01940 [bacterium]|nr:hypothetical protein [bacterium]